MVNIGFDGKNGFRNHSETVCHHWLHIKTLTVILTSAWQSVCDGKYEQSLNCGVKLSLSTQ